MATTLDRQYPCGECNGPYMRGHYLHALMFRHKVDCERRRQMDALAIMDIEFMHRKMFMRNIRPVELYLFECLQVDPMPFEDATVMLHLIGGQASRQYLRSNLVRLQNQMFETYRGTIGSTGTPVSNLPRNTPYDSEGF